MIHFSATLFSFAKGKSKNYAATLPIEEDQLSLFITNMNTYCKVIYFAYNNFVGSMKAFAFYHGTYLPPDSSSPDAFCEIPYYFPETFFLDSTNDGYFINPYECLVCKSSYTFDPVSKKCVQSPSTCSVNQQNFLTIIGKCEDCYANCKFPVCGNGILEGLETCDSGATGGSSACSSDCLSVKDTWKCVNVKIEGSDGKFKSSCSNNCASFHCSECSLDTSVGEWSCKVCESGYILLEKTNSIKTCVNSCPENYYEQVIESGKICSTCNLSNCSLCNSEKTKCLQCFSGKFLDTFNGVCYDDIPSTHYVYDQGFKYLLPCDQAMTDCQECANATFCKFCKNSKYLLAQETYQRKCVSSCPEIGYSPGKIFTVLICQPCKIVNCATCISNFQVCTQCKDNLYFDLTKSICVESIPPDYFIINKDSAHITTCTTFISNCYSCTNADNCTECLPATNNALLTVDNRTICQQEIPIGYYLDISTSIKILKQCPISNCISCSSTNPNQCNQCESGFFQDITTTICYGSPFPSTHYRVNDTSSLIQACSEVLENCSSCYNKTYCTSCSNQNSLYTLPSYKQNCVHKCPEGYYTALNSMSQNECFPCKVSNCSICSNDPNNCDLCKADQYQDILSTFCYSSKPSGYFFVNQTNKTVRACNSTDNGFDCVECEAADKCVKCKTLNLLVAGTTHLCVYTCPDKFASRVNEYYGKFCEACTINNCSSCPTDMNSCEKCIADNYLDKQNTTRCFFPSKIPEGYFVSDSLSKLIQFCNNTLKNCIKCVNETYCLQCESNYNLAYAGISTKKCVESCPSGFYVKTNDTTKINECDQCKISNCEKCDKNPLQCEKCFPGKLLDAHNKTCFDVFPSGYYYSNKSNDEIMPCNVSLTNCLLCDNASYCNVCQNDYYSFLKNDVSSTCVEKCPLNDYYSNETAKICEKCEVTFCSNCLYDVGKCSQCSENKFIDIEYNNSCLQTKPSTHYIVDNTSKLIKSCNLSIENCIKCENSTHCLECASDFGLLPVQNPNSQIICEKNTPSGYYKKNDSGIISYETCKVSNCKNCDINPNSQCAVCEEGDYLDILTNSTCFKNLEEGFFIFANDSSNNQTLIKPCNSSIIYCENCINANFCTKCHHLYSLSPEGTCLSECTEGFYLDESNNNSKKCLPCPIKNCSDCYSDKEKCFKCKPHKFLHSNLSVCYNEIPSDYFLFDNLTNIVKKCDTFIPNCETCKYDSQINQSTCFECSQKYLLFPPNKTNQYACVEDCPIEFRKDLLNICRKCEVENCSKCDNDSSKCERCLPNKYLINSSNESCLDYVPSKNYYISHIIHNNITNESTYTISLCNYSLPNCLECSNSTHCTKCEENLILNKNGKCKRNCPTNSFFDQSNENCEKCPLNCSGCFNKTSCKLCAPDFYSLNDSCMNCSLTQGFMPNCSEICGDGILFDTIKSGHQCDDGNLIDGDGCSSKCQIEKGFNCERIDNNPYIPDICFDASPIELQIMTRPDIPEKVIIHPSRKLKYNQNLASAINITIPSLDPSNYSISVDNEPNQMDITINILYKVNAKNAFMIFNLIPASKIQTNNNISNRNLQNSNNLSEIFSDEHNISIDEKYFNETMKVSLYPYENLNEEQKEQVENLEKVQSNVATTLVISTSSLSILQTLNIFWLMVDAMQIANFFLYINVFYPSNLQTYLKILSSANLNFIPNPFPSGTNDEDPEKKFKIFGNKIVDQRAPLRFESLEKTSLFLKNSGLQVVILGITWLFYLLIILATEYIKKNKIVSSWSAHVNKIREKLEFGWFIQIHLMIMLEFCLGCFLQIRNISGDNSTNIASAFLSLITLLYISLFLFQIVRVVNSKKKVVLEDKEFKRKYDILFEEYQKFKFMQRNYPAIVLIKKYLMVFSIVILHDYPVVELTALFAIFVGNLIILVVARPFKRKLTNAIMIFTELVFIIILALVSFIFSLDYKTNDMVVVPVEIVNTKIMYGWIIIALFSFILALYLVVFIRQQIFTFIELLVYLKESKKKYKDLLKEIFRKKMLNKPILKTTVSQGSICTCEMVEDPYKDLPKDKIDPKFYNLEKMPETSFSKFITNMKSKATNNSNNDNNENETQITMNSKERKEDTKKIKTQKSEDLQSPSFSYEKKQRETLIKSEMKKN